jgi:hypothetical protein
MRLRRIMSSDGNAQSSDLLPQSNTLRYFVAVVTGKGLQPGIDEAYQHIAHGDIDAAVKVKIADPQERARVLRLAAASDGASPEIVARTLALPSDQGIDHATVWTSLALAVRERKDPAPYVSLIREGKDEEDEKVLSFITSLRTAARPTDAELLLDGISIDARGVAYSTAVIILGSRAPAEWRRAADRLLFVPERPYLGVTAI